MGQLRGRPADLARIDERRESKLAPFDLFNLAVDAAALRYGTRPCSVPGGSERERWRRPPQPCSATNHACVGWRTADQRHALHLTVLPWDCGGRTRKKVRLPAVRAGGARPRPRYYGEDRERVFERFYTDASRSRETGGTGLGLSLAAVSSSMRGRIHIEETDGGGVPS